MIAFFLFQLRSGGNTIMKMRLITLKSFIKIELHDRIDLDEVIAIVDLIEKHDGFVLYIGNPAMAFIPKLAHLAPSEANMTCVT